MSTENQTKSRVPKWAQIADAARGQIAARNGWQKNVDCETQIAAEITANPETLKAFLRSARGQKGNDSQALRHRLLAEVRRRCPGRPVRHVGIFARVARFIRRLFRQPKPLAT